MSDILTRLKLPNSPYCGVMLYGRKTAEEMIAHARCDAQSMKMQAEACLNAPDCAFEICVVRGSVVQHLVSTI